MILKMITQEAHHILRYYDTVDTTIDCTRSESGFMIYYTVDIINDYTRNASTLRILL